MTIALADEDVEPICGVEWRRNAHIVGRVHSMRVQPWGDAATLEVVLRDETGGVSVVFLGRRRVAGIRLGTTLCVEGVVGLHHDRLAILNPRFEILVPEGGAAGQ